MNLEPYVVFGLCIGPGVKLICLKNINHTCVVACLYIGEVGLQLGHLITSSLVVGINTIPGCVGADIYKQVKARLLPLPASTTGCGIFLFLYLKKLQATSCKLQAKSYKPKLQASRAG